MNDLRSYFGVSCYKCGKDEMLSLTFKPLLQLQIMIRNLLLLKTSQSRRSSYFAIDQLSLLTTCNFKTRNQNQNSYFTPASARFTTSSTDDKGLLHVYSPIPHTSSYHQATTVILSFSNYLRTKKL